MLTVTALYAMAVLLIAAFLLEVRTGRIPNWLTLLPPALFIVVLLLADDRSALYWQIALAAGVFAAGLILFAIGGMGAGAVKLMAGAALFVPVGQAFYAFLVYLAAFFLTAVVIVQLRKFFGSEDSAWHVMAKPVIPLSLPIAVAGIAGMFLL